MEAVDKQPTKSKKDALIERLKAKRPDLNPEDEESLYGAIGEDYDNSESEINKYKEDESKLLDLFNSDNRTAGLFASMVNKGESPLEYLVAKYGDEFKAALEDPEMLSKLVEKQNQYTEKVASNKKLQAEAEQNLEASVSALKEAQTEMGCSDEDVTAAFESFSNILDDAIREKVSKETWIMFIKGITHDKDVEQAQLEGEVKGKNEKISGLKAKRTVPQGLPPQLAGQGEPKPSTPNDAKLGGVLDNYGSGYKPWDAELK